MAIIGCGRLVTDCGKLTSGHGWLVVSFERLVTWYKGLVIIHEKMVIWCGRLAPLMVESTGWQDLRKSSDLLFPPCLRKLSLNNLSVEAVTSWKKFSQPLVHPQQLPTRYFLDARPPWRLSTIICWSTSSKYSIPFLWHQISYLLHDLLSPQRVARVIFIMMQPLHVLGRSILFTYCTEDHQEIKGTIGGDGKLIIPFRKLLRQKFLLCICYYHIILLSATYVTAALSWNSLHDYSLKSTSVNPIVVSSYQNDRKPCHNILQDLRVL